MKHFVLFLIGWLTVSGVCTQVARAQTDPEEAPPPTTRLLFLLDGSGSMRARMDGEYSRMVVAKRLLSELTDSLSTVPNLELGLRVYGHQFDRRLKNCRDSKLEVGFSADNEDRIKDRLRVIMPKGTTPIAYSLEEAARDFTPKPNTRNVIIIITDGLESCDGDPCAVALALQRSRTFLKPFIIGLNDEGESFAEAFACLGQYFEAYDIRTFRRVLDQVMMQTLGETTLSLELLDTRGRPNETNVNVNFTNSVTGDSEYDFYHYLDAQGRPDKLPVDAVLSYDITVHTLPPVHRKNVYLEGGRHNVVRIPAPQGRLQVTQPGGTPQTQLPVVVRDRRTRETINVQQLREPVKYLVGSYDVEVLTLPRTHFKGVEIRQSETTKLQVVTPGLLSVSELPKGLGSIYDVSKDDRMELIHTFDGQTRLNLALQPGDYKLVFRAGTAHGSRFTDARRFSIRSGQTTNVQLFQ
ncbi:MAG: VWA domain-containing protein [Catalinimonas sp.]